MSRPPSDESFESLARKVNEAREVVNKAIETFNDLIRDLNDQELVGKLQHLVESLKPISIESARIFLSTFFTSLLLDDSILREHRRIYQELGLVLSERLHVSPEEGLLVSYYLVGQEDIADLAKDGVTPAAPEALLKRARDLLVAIKLQYANQISEKPRTVCSVIELYLIDPASSLSGVERLAISTDLDRDILPSEIREQLIRGNDPITYKLFPQERD